MDNKKNIFNKKISWGIIGKRDIALFARNLAIMIKSGLSLAEGLDILSSQSNNKLKKIIQAIKKSIDSGNSLAESFSKYPHVFSPFFIKTIEAGEMSGNLDSNLSQLSAQLDKEIDLIAKIKSAMFYPLIVLCLAIIIGLGLAFFVLPKITPLFLGLKIDLPWTTRLLIWISNFIKHDGYLFLLFLSGIIILFIYLGKQKFTKPFSHFIILKTPLLKKISQQKNLAIFNLSLGTLLKSGLDINNSLAVVSGIMPNYYYARAIKKIERQVSEGNNLTDSLKKQNKYFSNLDIGLIRVGESTGKLEEALLNLSDIYEKEIDRTVKILATAVEPVLLIIIGLIVGILALAIITPIYKITGNVYK